MICNHTPGVPLNILEAYLRLCMDGAFYLLQSIISFIKVIKIWKREEYLWMKSPFLGIKIIFSILKRTPNFLWKFQFGSHCSTALIYLLLNAAQPFSLIMVLVGHFYWGSSDKDLGIVAVLGAQNSLLSRRRKARERYSEQWNAATKVVWFNCLLTYSCWHVLCEL